MNTIGSRLKSERLAKGLSQEELARASGVTKQGISHIESDRTANPLASTIEPICRRLGLNARWLLDGKPPKYSADLPSQPLRIDADTIQDAQQALTAISQIQGVPSADVARWVNDPARLALAIDAVLTIKAQGERGGNIIDLMAKIAERIRQSGGSDAVKQGTAGNGGASYSAKN